MKRVELQAEGPATRNALSASFVLVLSTTKKIMDVQDYGSYKSSTFKFVILFIIHTWMIDIH